MATDDKKAEEAKPTKKDAAAPAFDKKADDEKRKTDKTVNWDEYPLN